MSNKKIDKKDNFVQDVKQLIADIRQQVAISVNDEISVLYWKIGQRIKTEIIGNKRAEYGKLVIKDMSENLTSEYGSGWSKKQLQHCLYTVETFLDFSTFSIPMYRKERRTC